MKRFALDIAIVGVLTGNIAYAGAGDFCPDFAELVEREATKMGTPGRPKITPFSAGYILEFTEGNKAVRSVYTDDRHGKFDVETTRKTLGAATPLARPPSVVYWKSRKPPRDREMIVENNEYLRNKRELVIEQIRAPLKTLFKLTDRNLNEGEKIVRVRLPANQFDRAPLVAIDYAIANLPEKDLTDIVRRGGQIFAHTPEEVRERLRGTATMEANATTNGEERRYTFLVAALNSMRENGMRVEADAVAARLIAAVEKPARWWQRR